MTNFLRGFSVSITLSAILPASVKRKGKSSCTKPRRLPAYTVVVHNDDRHTFEYVIETFQKILGIAPQKAFLLTESIHREGSACVWSGSKEVAELKRDQLVGAGPDFYANPAVRFPLGVSIEPLPG